MQTLLFILISFAINWLIYKLIDRVFEAPRTKSLITVILVNLVPLTFVAFTDIDIRLLVLAFIIESLFVLVLSIYEVIIARERPFVKIFALAKIIGTNLFGTFFYLMFFAAFINANTVVVNSYSVSSELSLENLDFSWLANGTQQFWVTLVFFACYYLYLGFMESKQENLDRYHLENSLRNIEVRDLIMFFSTFILAFSILLDSRVALLILILIKTIAYALATVFRYRTLGQTRFMWVDIAQELWDRYRARKFKEIATFNC